MGLSEDTNRLIDERDRLRAAIRRHRGQKREDRCWMDDQALYAVLQDGDLGDNQTGDPAAMLENCRRFIALRCAGGQWQSYADLERDRDRLLVLLADLAAATTRVVHVTCDCATCRMANLQLAAANACLKGRGPEAEAARGRLNLPPAPA